MILPQLKHQVTISFLSHTTGDTIDKLNFDKAVDFVKATLAWVVEVAA